MEIKVAKEYITLGQLLKLADIIQSGGEAKFAVKQLYILVIMFVKIVEEESYIQVI